MNNQHLYELLFHLTQQPQREEHPCHYCKPKPVVTKSSCQCCYCQSQRQVKVEPQVETTLHYTDFLIPFLTKYKNTLITDDYTLWVQCFKSYFKLFYDDDQKNETLAKAICDWMELKPKEEIKIPVTQEVKTEAQSVVGQLFKTLTGQQMTPEVNDLMTKISEIKPTEFKKLNTENINYVMSDILKMINKKPEVKDPKEQQADSILNEFLNTNHCAN
jgi:hypothetical protein